MCTKSFIIINLKLKYVISVLIIILDKLGFVITKKSEAVDYNF